MGTLTAALADRTSVRCGVEVSRVEVEDGDVVLSARHADGREQTYRAPVAILATPADVAARLYSGAPEDVRRHLEGVQYSSGFGVYLRTKEPIQPTGRGGKDLYMELVPPGERDGPLHAVAFLNHLAPDGGFLRVESAPAASTSLDDEPLAERLQADVEQLHPDLKGAVTATRSERATRVVPAYPVGAVRKLASFRSRLGPGPVQLAGDYLYGPCMESAAQSGKAAALRADAYLRDQ